MKRVFTCAAFAATILMAGCTGSKEPTSQEDLADCYRSEFGASLPSAVGALQARQVMIGDTWSQWLHFTADAATVDSIIAGGFEPSDRTTFTNEAGGPNAPAWWRSNSDKLEHFYVHRQWHKRGDSGRAYLAYDAAKKIVHFRSLTVD